ncbi:hypothetical protein [Gracilimonas amylolytica]|uniref:hypothetical protein n=1 Tax=Gracilimonas amylolytica TaxID=1749045 RepID=UPI000CD9C8F4|nr:hypothetical protein [Gracilimonas amylolytica]
MPEIKENEIRNATIDAIYWWNRSEHYYHHYFSKIDAIHKNPDTFKFFVQKIFMTFLSDYSVRRNLSSGEDSVYEFIDGLLKYSFISECRDGNLKIIDEISKKLHHSKVTKNSTVSLLSKIAFLINPSSYSLYDSLSRKSLYKLKNKESQFTHSDIQEYSRFLEEVLNLKKRIMTDGHSKFIQSILQEYKQTKAYEFFRKHETAFELRVVDKILWIKSTEREIDNSGYLSLLLYNEGE